MKNFNKKKFEPLSYDYNSTSKTINITKSQTHKSDQSKPNWTIIQTKSHILNNHPPQNPTPDHPHITTGNTSVFSNFRHRNRAFFSIFDLTSTQNIHTATDTPEHSTHTHTLCVEKADRGSCEPAWPAACDCLPGWLMISQPSAMSSRQPGLTRVFFVFCHREHCPFYCWVCVCFRPRIRRDCVLELSWLVWFFFCFWKFYWILFYCMICYFMIYTSNSTYYGSDSTFWLLILFWKLFRVEFEI